MSETRPTGTFFVSASYTFTYHRRGSLLRVHRTPLFHGEPQRAADEGADTEDTGNAPFQSERENDGENGNDECSNTQCGPYWDTHTNRPKRTHRNVCEERVKRKEHGKIGDHSDDSGGDGREGGR